jgi:hypothetical protein
MMKLFIFPGVMGDEVYVAGLARSSVFCLRQRKYSMCLCIACRLVAVVVREWRERVAFCRCQAGRIRVRENRQPRTVPQT